LYDLHSLLLQAATFTYIGKFISKKTNVLKYFLLHYMQSAVKNDNYVVIVL